MWDVRVVHASWMRVRSGRMRIASWINVVGEPGIESIVCARRDPWRVEGLACASFDMLLGSGALV